MTTIHLVSGGTIETESLPDDEDLLTQKITQLDVAFESLTGLDEEADLESFFPEIRRYLKDLFKIRGTPPQPVFLEAGLIGETAYWVFDAALAREAPLYVLVVRKEATTEMFCAEQSASFLDDDETVVDRPLTPAQAALLDLCLESDGGVPDPESR